MLCWSFFLFPQYQLFAFLQPYVGSVLAKNVTIRKVVNLPTFYKGIFLLPSHTFIES